MADELQKLHDAINTLALGEKFTGNKLDFVITGTQSTGERRERPRRNRTIRVTLSGDEARMWIENPNWDDIWDAYGCYFSVEDDEDLPNDSSLHDVSVSISAS